MKHDPTQDMFFDFIMRLHDPYLFMTLNGVQIDLKKRDELRAEFVAERADCITRLEKFAEPVKVIGKTSVSNKGLAYLLYEKMNLPAQYHPKTKQVTTNEEALLKLRPKVPEHFRAVFNDILRIRELGILISTNLDTTLDSDNRLRCSYNVAGTVSGRISTYSSPWWTGTNTQNWSTQVRDIVITDPDRVFLYIDGEQAEARVVAKLCKDRRYAAIFDSGQDVHRLMGEIIFGVPAKDISDAQRQDAKRTVHGANYGMGEPKFARMHGMPLAKARALLGRYHAEFPAIRGTFHRGVEARLKQSRSLTTPLGRARIFFGRWGDDMLREAYSYIPQSVVGDWMNVGLLRMWMLGRRQRELSNLSHPDSYAKPFFSMSNAPSELLGVDIHPVIQIHDGTLFSVAKDQIDEGIAVLDYATRFPIPFQEVGPLIIPTDLKIGLRWGSLYKPTPPWKVTCMYDCANPAEAAAPLLIQKQ